MICILAKCFQKCRFIFLLYKFGSDIKNLKLTAKIPCGRRHSPYTRDRCNPSERCTFMYGGLPPLLSLTFRSLQDKGKRSRGVIFFILHPDLLLYFRYYYCDCRPTRAHMSLRGPPYVKISVMLLLFRIYFLLLFVGLLKVTLAVHSKFYF